MTFNRTKQPERFAAAFSVAMFAIIVVAYQASGWGVIALAVAWTASLYALALFRDWRASR